MKQRFESLSQGMREHIRSAVIAFVALIAVGYVLTLLRPESTQALTSLFTTTTISSGAVEATSSELFVLLFFNNLVAALTAILCGFVPFLHLPAFSLGLNSVLLGAFGAFYQKSGPGLLAYLAGTIPHGVTEIFSLAMACGAGLHLCRTVTDRLTGRQKEPTVSQAWRECAQVYLRYVVPLLLFSAAVEAFITPLILNLFL